MKTRTAAFGRRRARSLRVIVLASASPRRRDLLKKYFKLKIIPADCDESVKRGESARKYVARVAKAKWMVVARMLEASAKTSRRPRVSRVVVSADTTVVLAGKIFGKPRNAAEASRMLAKFSGRTHRVMTAVCVGVSSARSPQFRFVVSTSVRFRKISPDELEKYIRSDEWRGKAGAYGIQGRASKFVAKLIGSLTNVIGLPVDQTLAALKEANAAIAKKANVVR